ncbi:uncharacterized protein [Palaemon carinicauda]|uniref:uncharacterized protein n=1 Tax=Palaemon carinicauda TaxID=392227 RepID=UPI0035B58DB6
MANNLPNFFILLIVACVSLSIIPGGTSTHDIIHSDVSDMELSVVEYDLGPDETAINASSTTSPSPSTTPAPSASTTTVPPAPAPSTTPAPSASTTTVPPAPAPSTTPAPSASTTPAPSASTTTVPPAPSASTTPAPSASTTTVPPAPSASTTPAPSASTTPAPSASTTPVPTAPSPSTTPVPPAPSASTTPAPPASTTPAPPASTTPAPSTSPQTPTPEGPTESTSEAPPPTTQHPNLNKKEVLDETDNIIVNITGTIAEFQNALTDAIQTTITIPTTTDSPKAREEFIAKYLSDLVHIFTEGTNGDSMCLANNTKCEELEKTLEAIDQQLQFLKDNVDKWDQTRMEDLETLSLDLTDKMSYATDPDFINKNINVTITQTKLEGISEKADEAKKVVEDEINDLSNGVIFTAVFGTLGGLIIISLIVGLAYAIIKGRKSKKPNNKAYKEVQEENVPIDGFLHDHDNMAYEDDEPAKPRNDAYPLKPFNKPTPPPKDPYRRREEIPVDDLYAKPLKSKNSQAVPSSTNYSRSEYDRDPRHEPKPSTSAGDNYYSRPSSSRDNYYSTPEGPQKENHYNGRDASRPYDAYAAPTPNDPAPRGGLRRFN